MMTADLILPFRVSLMQDAPSIENVAAKVRAYRVCQLHARHKASRPLVSETLCTLIAR